mmetsp:Transcript_14844/g.20660  ORF Transcript_14844/g.20660 Transcript_14844/m.20660 type:complete len:217 (+) Transcript_14844:751-1401(+)
MVIACSLLVALSLALTFTMPLASMSKVTSIWGAPRGAGGTPVSSKLPRSLLSAAISRSPCSTLIPTTVWLSAAVEKTCDFFVGMVVLRLIRRVNTPPSVSIPSDRGVTSRRRMSLTSPRSTPPWIAAPLATTSSGFTPLLGALPKKFSTVAWTLGMRVIPPTRRTASTSLRLRPASLRHASTGGIVRDTRVSASFSKSDLFSLSVRCFGPVASAVM